MDRLDPVMSVILKAGTLSLRELFTRLGREQEAALRLVELVRQGDLKLEPIEGRWDPLAELGLKLSDTNEQLARGFAQASESDIADRIELVPTTKAWRNPFAAA